MTSPSRRNTASNGASCKAASGRSRFLCNAVLTLALLALAEATAQNCTVTVGTYRDCLCGVKYRDVETECHDDLTYYQPVVSQQNLTCTHQCLNGGIPFTNRRCSCGTGAHGERGCCEIPTPFCGKVYLEPTGNIWTTGFFAFKPPSYLPNEDCIWKISTDQDRRIALGMVNNTFDLHQGNIYTCDSDYLELHDGDSSKSRKLGRFCGTAHGTRGFKTFYSSGRHFYLTFKSNGSQEGLGFHLQYKTFPKEKHCGPRTSFSLPTGLIPSPQYPINYRPRESCEYEIHVKPGHDLILRTLEMNVPTGNSHCQDWNDDRILIMKKRTGSKVYEEVEKYCGNQLYPFLPIRGASSVMLKFTSNNEREGRFLLQYEQVPI